MKWFGFLNKVDSNIKPYFNINSRRKIPVIVCCKENKKDARTLILKNNGYIKYEYTEINAFACDMASIGIDRISESAEVDFVLLDYKASLCIIRSKTQIGIKIARKFNLTGRDVGVGIIDTGLYPHNDIINGRIKPVYFEDLLRGYRRLYDDNGHGTFISGCIGAKGQYEGVAPDANICMIKAFDQAGKGFMSDIIRGIESILSIKDAYNIKIMCLPFEFPYFTDIKINPLEDILKICIKKNILTIVPSGNSGPAQSSIYFPGNMNEVVTVSGCYTDEKTEKLKVPAFSGRGSADKIAQKPDICAPSVNITSICSDITYYPSFKDINLKNDYTIMSGTSVSCALATGFTALIMEKTPNLSPSDLKSMLLLSCVSIGESKYAQGKGLLSLDRILN